ncbi:MAG: class A beta-lactamase-related serine hydrolase, partial [Caulobacteraceae bacterium]|nr:class A beta-lactamase-related serine hydrolase [Caulobacteraceae bacterium]
MDDAITASLKGHLEAGNIVGAATRVWRDGALVHSADLGLRDPDQRLPVEPGTIYRIASLSKPVTALAALILMEAGRFALADPITVIAPEFADMRVLRSPTGPLDDTDPAIRQITFEDLLTHRSGLTYGDFQTGPIAAAYRDTLGGDLDSHVAPDDWIAGLARLPLIAQPGAAFNYSASSDLLGLLLARMEGV